MMIKEIVLSALAAIFTNQDTAITHQLLSETYIQHNPSVPTGRAPIIDFLPALKKANISVKTYRIISEGDFVVTHNLYDNAELIGGDKLIGFDVFRVENGKIVEHWDNLSVLAPLNPSGRSQFDGPTDVIDHEKTDENKALVVEFVNTILLEGKFDRLAEFFKGDEYIQHNTQIGDGLSGLGTALEVLKKKGISMTYKKVHKVIAEGNFVFTMSEGEFGGKPTAYFDLFRVENGRIAEHWDVISEIPAKMAHENGKF